MPPEAPIPTDVDDPRFMVLVGHSFAGNGDYETAAEWFERAVDVDPLLVGGWTELSLLPGYDLDEQQTELVRSIPNRRDLDDEERAVWALGLSTILRRRGDPDAAWELIEEMNAALRRSRPYARTPDAVFLSDVLEHLDADYFEDRRVHDTGSRAPIFVYGLPRSGTTLVEQILASHPSVRAGGEMDAMIGLAVHAYRAGPREGSYVRALPRLTPTTWDELRTMARQRYDAAAAGTARVTDKMPSNYRHLGLMKVLFPNAKFVSMVRRPMDVCVSNYMLMYGQEHSYANSFATLARTWADHRDLVRHWDDACPAGVYHLQYEDLVRAQEAETRRLLDYCELEWDDSCLAFDEQHRHIATASRFQVRRPMYTTSVGAWRRYEPYLDDLRSALSDVGAPTE